MNSRTPAVVALGVLATIVCVAAGIQSAPQSAESEEDRMMRLWAEVATPGPAHEMLQYFVGDWTYTMKMWMGGPGAPPMETAGESITESIFGGRFIMARYTGEMMGHAMEGIGVTGFDNFKKKFVSVWFDNRGTAITTSEGLLDRSGKVLTFFGSMDEWMTGEHDKTVKYVYRIIGEDEFVFEIHDLGIVPGETKVIEIVYTRKP